MRNEFLNNYGIGHGQRVLIDGGAGFVGSNLAKELLSLGYEVFAVDNLITGRTKNIASLNSSKKFHFLRLDITDNRFFHKFKRISVDQIYHLACPTGVPNIKILGEEMIKTSSIGTFNILEIARIHKAKVVFSSSAEVYGQPRLSPQVETYNGDVDPIGPRSAYEEGKRFSESIVKMYTQKHHVNAKIVRIFNTYGPGMSLFDQRVMPQFLKSIKNQEKLTIYGNGDQTRTFLYIDDLINGLRTIMHKGKIGEVYNIGGKKQITIKKLAEIMIGLANYPSNIQYLPHFIEDHSEREPDTNKVSLLGWEQRVSLEDGLKLMMKANNIGEFVNAGTSDTNEVQQFTLQSGALPA